MSKMVLSAIRRLGEHVRRVSGDEVFRQVMAGSERITVATKLERVATWTQGAIARLERLVDDQTAHHILSDCGSECALGGLKTARKTGAKRVGYPNLDAFLEAEFLSKPGRGAQFHREGDRLYMVYTPRAFGIRCYCPLLRKLPEAEAVSAAYCQCSLAFAQRTWEAILNRPVQVDLLESCLSGATECKFAVHLEEAQ